MKTETYRPETLSAKERYSLIEEKAWNWYERNISYNTYKTGVELVTLRGNREGQIAIKIPVSKDTWEYRKRIEEEFEIKIGKYLFSCDFSLLHEPIKYKVYSYRYILN